MLRSDSLGGKSVSSCNRFIGGRPAGCFSMSANKAPALRSAESFNSAASFGAPYGARKVDP